MSTEIAEQKTSESFGVIESVMVQGNLASLSADDRARYYAKVCQSLGLNPLTKPFDYIVMNGKLVLYARKDCAEQLRKIHRVSLKIVSRESVGDCYVVTSQASMPNGRIDESIGAVSIAGLKGAELANALMKTETKSKRRATLSICGLGFMDESEIVNGDMLPSPPVDTIPVQPIEEPGPPPPSANGEPRDPEPDPDAAERISDQQADWLREKITASGMSWETFAARFGVKGLRQLRRSEVNTARDFITNYKPTSTPAVEVGQQPQDAPPAVDASTSTTSAGHVIGPPAAPASVGDSIDRQQFAFLHAHLKDKPDYARKMLQVLGLERFGLMPRHWYPVAVKLATNNYDLDAWKAKYFGNSSVAELMKSAVDITHLLALMDAKP